MAKDPAFLFYPNDYMGGTLGMTLEEKGAYMELLILQFNKGHFTIEQAKKLLNGSFERLWDVVKEKFKEDETHGFFNERLAFEMSIRRRDIELIETYVYLIKMSNNIEEFLKIGISNNLQNRYYNYRKAGFVVTQIDVIKYNLRSDAEYNEILLHNKFKSFSYIPKTNFAGQSECFTLEIINQWH